jgi:O-antigen/teichoic acid export membrane protein
LLKNRIIAKNQFTKNIVTLMTGTGIAQAIPVALSPILTRIYSPEDFGLFALYTGVFTVLLVLTTCNYEHAILLPEKEDEALDIVKLVFFLSLVISSIIGILVWVFNKGICEILENEDIGPWLYFLPFSTFVSGMYKTLNYWFNRKRDFKRLAQNRVIQSSFTGGSQVFLSYLNSNGLNLLIGSLIGQLITVLTLFIKFFKAEKGNILDVAYLRLKKIAFRYSDFPKYDLPSSLLNVGSTHAPNILFATLFASNYSGFYYLTQRVLQAPITLISTSVLDVFKEEAARVYREEGNAKKIYLKTFKWLLTISLIPSILMFFFIEDLFVFFFGSEWVIAGVYAKILLPSLTIKFLANPLSFMFYVAEKQKWNLIIMIFLVVGIFLSFFIPDNHINVIKLISLTLTLYYSVHLVISAKLAKVF